jgi:hypothetical protein
MNSDELSRESENQNSWQTKVFYAVVGIIIFAVIYHIYDSRGGRFLVRACNNSTDKCYTVEADLERETKASPGATLYFENGGSLHVICGGDFGCESDELESWEINKIKRL